MREWKRDDNAVLRHCALCELHCINSSVVRAYVHCNDNHATEREDENKCKLSFVTCFFFLISKDC